MRLCKYIYIYMVRMKFIECLLFSSTFCCFKDPKKHRETYFFKHISTNYSMYPLICWHNRPVVIGAAMWRQHGVDRSCFLPSLPQTTKNIRHLWQFWYCLWKKSGQPVEVGSLSHYLRGFIHPRWLFWISSINSTNRVNIPWVTIFSFSFKSIHITR